MNNVKINYKQIYIDLIAKKNPENKEEILLFLKDKEELSALDIIRINKKLFGFVDKKSRKYRSYSKSDILKILDYQKKHQLNNTQLAKHFELSRNTVTKWKKIFK